MSRVVVALSCACLSLPGPGGVAAVPAPSISVAAMSATSIPASAAVRYSAPVVPTAVARAFEPPPNPYAAGHRGVDLATAPGQSVVAAGAGRVRFAGKVAGRGVVVIEHPDGVSTEYEPVTPSVAAGASVERGQVIARVRGRHGACAPGGCLHWGARRNGDYFDPMTLLTPLGPVRLLPWAAGSIKVAASISGERPHAAPPVTRTGEYGRPDASPPLRRADGRGRRSAATARPRCACRSGWSPGWRARAAPARFEGPRHRRAGG